MTRSRERGYAMIAAVAGIAAFSYVAFEVIAENRGVISGVQSENERARLSAACDAGMSIAIAGLAAKDKTQQWPIDGVGRNFTFDDVALTITVEDERGKIPLNGVNEDQVRDLFQDAGASGTQLDTIVDSFEDWIDPDDDRRPHGAEGMDYASLGVHPRNGGFRSIGELRLIKGMNDQLFAAVAPAVTVFFGESGGFSEGTSQILALQSLEELPPTAPEVLERQRELSGQQPPKQSSNPPSLLARTLTVRVVAKRAGASVQRSAIIELTGNAADPVWIRTLD